MSTLSTAGTTTKTQMKKRMRRSLKRTTLRKMKTMRKRMTTKPWDTAVSVCNDEIKFRFHEIASVQQALSTTSHTRQIVTNVVPSELEPLCY